VPCDTCVRDEANVSGTRAAGDLHGGGGYRAADDGSAKEWDGARGVGASETTGKPKPEGGAWKRGSSIEYAGSI